MKLIESPTTNGPTTIQKVSYKGNIWERRENSKAILWFVYDSEGNRGFVYHWLNNGWIDLLDNTTPSQNIEMPYVERSYQKLINPLKLYEFTLECFYTTLYGMFVASEQEVQSAMGKTLYFGQVDKDREVSELFSWYMLYELPVSKVTIEDLLKTNGRGNNTVCGYNPLEYIKE